MKLEKYSKMTKTFPSLVTDIRLKVQESQRTSCKINQKKAIPWYIISQTFVNKIEKILKSSQNKSAYSEGSSDSSDVNF